MDTTRRWYDPSFIDRILRRFRSYGGPSRGAGDGRCVDREVSRDLEKERERGPFDRGRDRKGEHRQNREVTDK